MGPYCCADLVSSSGGCLISLLANMLAVNEYRIGTYLDVPHSLITSTRTLWVEVADDGKNPPTGSRAHPVRPSQLDVAPHGVGGPPKWGLSWAFEWPSFLSLTHTHTRTHIQVFCRQYRKGGKASPQLPFSDSNHGAPGKITKDLFLT